MHEDLRWQKSTFSSGNPESDCVELAARPRTHGTDGGPRLYVRESEAPEVVLTTTPARLGALLTAIRRTPLAAGGAEAPCSGA